MEKVPHITTQIESGILIQGVRSISWFYIQLNFGYVVELVGKQKFEFKNQVKPVYYGNVWLNLFFNKDIFLKKMHKLYFFLK